MCAVSISGSCGCQFWAQWLSSVKRHLSRLPFGNQGSWIGSGLVISRVTKGDDGRQRVPSFNSLPCHSPAGHRSARGVGWGGQIVPFDSCRQHTHTEIITITINRTKQDNACGESGRGKDRTTVTGSKGERERASARPWTSVASNTKGGWRWTKVSGSLNCVMFAAVVEKLKYYTFYLKIVSNNCEMQTINYASDLLTDDPNDPGRRNALSMSGYCHIRFQ